MKTRALILAAGKGKRMKSEKSKVLHQLRGKSLIEHVFNALNISEIEKIGVVVSDSNRVEIQKVLDNRVDYIIQKEQLGTGHAVLAAENWLSGFTGRIIIVVGDAPFLKKQTVRNLLYEFEQKNCACVFLSAVYDQPPPYGRVIRNEKGSVIKIVEAKDATSEQIKIQEVSSSHYCFEKSKLFDALKQINNQNAQGEYYLPDVIRILINNNEIVEALPVKNSMITFGINSPEDLLNAEKMMVDPNRQF
jgi:bifunctional UDP-N-acetylglucosamine pyrophosphorylase/glucosamine-1-phosphate N-acetyltransferase